MTLRVLILTSLDFPSMNPTETFCFEHQIINLGQMCQVHNMSILGYSLRLPRRALLHLLSQVRFGTETNILHFDHWS